MWRPKRPVINFWDIFSARRMAKKSKTKKISTMDVEEIKAQIWDAIVANGGELINEWGDIAPVFESKVRPSIDKLLSDMTVELPAIRIAVKDIREFDSLVEDGSTNNGFMTTTEKSLRASVESMKKFVNDKHALFEYHEREMQRHAEAAQKLKVELG